MKRHRRITTDCGWLGPDGSWYPCGQEEHKELAREILIAAGVAISGPDRTVFSDPEQLLEERRWAKLIPASSPMGVVTPGFVSWRGNRPTPRQARALLEWCTGEGEGMTELPACLEPDPPTEELP